MSGHNKWTQIKHKKASTDAAKSRIFSRYARLITLESKKSGGDVSAPSLAAAITRAKSENMPKDNIERAVAKGISKDANDLEQVSYEAYGPGGVAIIIDALTDNKNRSTQEIKHLLSKNGIEMAPQGAASWAFAKSPDGLLTPHEPLVDMTDTDEHKLQSILGELAENDDVQITYTNARGYEHTSE